VLASRPCRTGMITTNSQTSMPDNNASATATLPDWSKLTVGEQIKHLELEGFLVMPGLLSPEQVAHFKKLTSAMETKATDYSDKQRGRGSIHWEDPSFAE